MAWDHLEHNGKMSWGTSLLCYIKLTMTFQDHYALYFFILVPLGMKLLHVMVKSRNIRANFFQTAWTGESLQLPAKWVMLCTTPYYQSKNSPCPCSRTAACTVIPQSTNRSINIADTIDIFVLVFSLTSWRNRDTYSALFLVTPLLLAHHSYAIVLCSSVQHPCFCCLRDSRGLIFQNCKCLCLG